MAFDPTTAVLEEEEEEKGFQFDPTTAVEDLSIPQQQPVIAPVSRPATPQAPVVETQPVIAPQAQPIAPIMATGDDEKDGFIQGAFQRASEPKQEQEQYDFGQRTGATRTWETAKPKITIPEPRTEEEKGAWNSFFESLKRGDVATSIDTLGFQASLGMVDWDTQVKPIIDKYRELEQVDPIKGRNWFTNAFLGAVRMVPGMAKGSVQGGVAAGAAAALGQLGPQVGLPEEIVTVPTAFTLGSMQYWTRQGGGATYNDLREEGVNDDVSRWVSFAAGPMYAAIENLQLKGLMPKGIGGDIKKQIGRTIAQKVLVYLAKTGKTYAQEVGEEGLQFVVTETAKNVGKWIDPEVQGETLSEATKEILKGAANEMIEASKSMPFLMVPGMTYDATQAMDAVKKAKQPVYEDVPKPETIELNKQENVKDVPVLEQVFDKETKPVEKEFTPETAVEEKIDVPFKTAEEAKKFGETATEEQMTAIKTAEDTLRKQGEDLIKEKKLQEAVEPSTKAQLAREAREYFENKTEKTKVLAVDKNGNAKELELDVYTEDNVPELKEGEAYRAVSAKGATGLKYGKGLYSSESINKLKESYEAKKFVVVPDAKPNNPLIAKNQLELNKKFLELYPDIQAKELTKDKYDGLLQAKGYDGVIVGDEIVRFSKKDKPIKEKPDIKLNNQIKKWAANEYVNVDLAEEDGKKFKQFAMDYYNLGKSGKRIIDMEQSKKNIEYPPFLEDKFYNLGKAKAFDTSSIIEEGGEQDVKQESLPGKSDKDVVISGQEKISDTKGELQPGERSPDDSGYSEERSRTSSKRNDELGERSSERLLDSIPDEAVEAYSASQETLEESKVAPISLKDVDSYEQKGGKKGASGVEILSAYFTPKPLSELMQDAITKYIPISAGQILEPSVGDGGLLTKLYGNHSITAIEINQRTANIVKSKYPDAKVYNTWSEKFFHDNKEKFDAVIMNPPYNAYKSFFKTKYKDKGADTYTDFFLRESSKVLHNNGTMVVLMPHTFLRQGITPVKKIMIAEGMNLEAAFRLPDGIFGKSVKIPIDLVVFKKTGTSNEAVWDNNEYFKQNPDNVLGEITEGKGYMGRPVEIIKGDIPAAYTKMREVMALREDVKPVIAKKETTEKAMQPTTKETAVAKNKTVEKSSKEKEVAVTKGTKSDLTSIGDKVSEEIYGNLNYDGSVNLKTTYNQDLLNFEDGKVYPNEIYIFGNIANKLKQLEEDKSRISKSQYDKQKKLLNSVMPRRLMAKEMDLDPTTSYFKEFDGVEGQTGKIARSYLEWLRKEKKYKYGLGIDDIYEYFNGRMTGGAGLAKNYRDAKSYQKALDIEMKKRENRKLFVSETFREFLEFIEQGMPEVIEDINNDLFSNNIPKFDKFPFFINDISKTFKGEPLVISKHQKEAVGFLSAKGVGYFAGEVGSGKTMVNIIMTEKALQSGKAKRPVIIAPGHILNNFETEYPELFPKRKIVNLDNLGATVKKPKMEDGVVYLMSYTAFDNIKYTKETIQEIKKFLYEQKKRDSSKNNKRKNETDMLDIEGLIAKLGDKGYFFEDLNFDMVSFDEAHKMRKLFAFTSADYKKLAKSSPSAIAIRGYVFASNIFRTNKMQNVFMYSATPFNNKPDEIYNALSFIAFGKMADMGVTNLEDFTKQFAGTTYDWAVDSNNNLAKRQIVTGFKNAVALRQLINSYVLPKFSDELDLIRPEKKRITQFLQESEKEKEMIAPLREKYDLLPKMSKEERKQLQLSIQNDIRKAAVSPYLLVDNINDYSAKEIVENSSKLKFIADQIKNLYDQNNDSGQIVYNPLGKELMPKFTEYMIEYKGFKKEQIATISGSTSKKERERIEKDFNGGKIKILIGTSAIREGLNLQAKTVAMYSTLIEWNPTDMIQFEGRGFRQGNQFKEIYIIYPLLENSGDSVYLQKFYEKSSRFNDIFEGKDNYIEKDDIDPEAARLDLITDPVKKAEASISMDQEKVADELVSIEQNLKNIMNMKVTKKTDLSSRWWSADLNIERINKLAEKEVLDEKYYNKLIDDTRKAINDVYKPRLEAEFIQRVKNFEARYDVKYPGKSANREKFLKKNDNIPESSYPSYPSIGSVYLSKTYDNDNVIGIQGLDENLVKKISDAVIKRNEAIDTLKVILEERQTEKGLAKEAIELTRRSLIDKFTKEANKPRDPIVMLKTLEYRNKKVSSTDALVKAASNIDEVIDETMGKSAGFVGFKNISEKVNIPEEFKFENEEVEKRWQDSKGITPPSFASKVGDKLVQLKGTTRQFPLLDPEVHALNVDLLREYKNLPEYSKLMAKESIKGILGKLGPKKYDLFIRGIILPDILKDIDRGLYDEKELPFGFEDRTEIVKYIRKYDKIIEANPEVKEAITMRNKVINTIRDELVSYGLLPENVLEYDAYFHHQVLEYINLKKAYAGTGSRDVRTHKKGFQRGRTGSAKDFNTEYMEAEFEMMAQALSQIGTQKILDRIQAFNDISSSLKATAKKSGEDWRDLLPPEYVLWQPKEGSTFYQANSLTEKVIDSILTGEINFEDAELKQVLAMGKKKQQWAIPEELAKTLDSFMKPMEDNIISKASMKTLQLWKKQILLNPLRLIKYNVNNLSGDLDIALAYDFRILKYVPGAVKDLWKYHHQKKGVTKELSEMVRTGVISSGLTMQEIPDIKTQDILDAISLSNPGIIAKYWDTVSNYTNFRENILRVAAYRYFVDKLKTGGKIYYGASKRKEIDLLLSNGISNDILAAKLGRELIGDYGKTSQAGTWLSEKMYPFFRWVEVNAQRYVNLLKNLPYEGRSSGSQAKTATALLAFKSAKKLPIWYLKVQLLFILINLWNKIFFPDEDKEVNRERNQMHLILGHGENGLIHSLRVQGAVSDALSWIGLERYPYDIADVISGKKTVGEIGMNILKAPVNKFITGIRPIEKTLFEILMKKSLYPDITRPRAIRDPGEHASGLFGAKKVYRAIKGLPTRGFPQELVGLLLYSTDAGESAYYAIKELGYKFKNKGKDAYTSFTPTKRSNYLYYYKQSLKYGDENKAKKFLDKYMEAGGSNSGLRRSIAYTHPIGMIKKSQREAFLKTLGKDDRELFDSALEWYKKTYK